MVDNKGITSVTAYFKSGDPSGMANKMSDEKQGQGGEYAVFEKKQKEEEKKEEFQDRSAQLRASLSGLAARNAGMIEFYKKIKEKEQEQKRRKKPLYIDDELDETSQEDDLFEQEF